MKKLICVVLLVVFGISSCTTFDRPQRDYDFPLNGKINNSSIVVKDYVSLGIIFLKSTEVVDSKNNHTGSKITYEMLMLEAQKLNADDVINIKIDVNQKEEIFTEGGIRYTRTTYDYTASALAIKYTTAVSSDAVAVSHGYDLEQTMLVTKPQEAPVTNKPKSRVGRVLGIVGGLAAVGIITSVIIHWFKLVT